MIEKIIEHLENELEKLYINKKSNLIKIMDLEEMVKYLKGFLIL